MFPEQGPYQKTRKYESRIRKPGKRQHVAKRLRDLDSSERETRANEPIARQTPSASPPLLARSPTAPTPADLPTLTLPPKLRAKNWARQSAPGNSPVADENETDTDRWSGSDSNASASSKTGKIVLSDILNPLREPRKEEQEDKKQVLEPSTLHHLNRNRNTDDRDNHMPIPEETVYTVKIPRSRYQGDGYLRFVDADDGSVLGLHMHALWDEEQPHKTIKSEGKARMIEDTKQYDDGQRSVINIKQEKRSRIEFEEDFNNIMGEQKPKFRRLVSGREREKEREKHRDYNDGDASRGFRMNWRD